MTLPAPAQAPPPAAPAPGGATAAVPAVPDRKSVV